MGLERHPVIHKGYQLRVEVLHLVEEWKSKEDSHGGPAYYPREYMIARTLEPLSTQDLHTELKRLYRRERSNG